MLNAPKYRAAVFGILTPSLCTIALLAHSARADVPFTLSTEADGISIAFEKPSISLQVASDGEASIAASGFDVHGIPGNPALPIRELSLALPPDANPESVELSVVDTVYERIPGEHTIAPAPPRKLWNEEGSAYANTGRIVGGKNLDVYEADAYYPKMHVETNGISRMREWNVLKLSYAPVQFNPVTKTLRIAASLTVRVSYKARPFSAAVLSQDAVADEMGPRLLANYKDAKNPYSPEAAYAGRAMNGGRGYVIITTEAIRSASRGLEAFAAHKRNRGFSTEIITERQFGRMRQRGPAEKIREWLKQNYLSKQIQYVLLVGDPTPERGGIPMKRCHPLTEGGRRMDTPTDYFYADLSGTWDLNRDGVCGDYNRDRGAGGVDFLPEVYVGRIPVYGNNAGRLDAILAKIEKYENATDSGWRKSVLMPMGFADPRTDTAAVAEHAKNDYLTGMGYSTWTMYQWGASACHMRSAYTPDEELVGGRRVVNRWRADTFGLVFWSGHGSPRGAYVGFEGCWDDADSNGEIIESSGARLLNDTRPSIVFQQSCLNGRPEDPSNLAYSLLQHGAIATIASSRDSWYLVGHWKPSRAAADDGAVGYYFTKSMAEGASVGEALYDEKAKMGWDWAGASWMNLMDFNLYGDPSLELFPSTVSASPPQPSPPSIIDDASSLLRYSGKWSRVKASEAHNGSYRLSRVRGSRARSRFTGTQVHIAYFTGPKNGTLRVLIDGRFAGHIRERGAPRRAMWSSPVLRAGTHTITLSAATKRATLDAISISN